MDIKLIPEFHVCLPVSKHAFSKIMAGFTLLKNEEVIISVKFKHYYFLETQHFLRLLNEKMVTSSGP